LEAQLVRERSKARLEQQSSNYNLKEKEKAIPQLVLAKSENNLASTVYNMAPYHNSTPNVMLSTSVSAPTTPRRTVSPRIPTSDEVNCFCF